MRSMLRAVEFSMKFKAANRNIAAALGVFSVSREDAVSV